MRLIGSFYHQVRSVDIYALLAKKYLDYVHNQLKQKMVIVHEFPKRHRKESPECMLHGCKFRDVWRPTHSVLWILVNPEGMASNVV